MVRRAIFTRCCCAAHLHASHGCEGAPSAATNSYLCSATTCRGTKSTATTLWMRRTTTSATSRPSESPPSRRAILVSVPSDACRRPISIQARMALFATCQAHARRRNEPSPTAGSPPVPPEAYPARCVASHRLALWACTSALPQTRRASIHCFVRAVWVVIVTHFIATHRKTQR